MSDVRSSKKRKTSRKKTGENDRIDLKLRETVE